MRRDRLGGLKIPHVVNRGQGLDFNVGRPTRGAAGHCPLGAGRFTVENRVGSEKAATEVLVFSDDDGPLGHVEAVAASACQVLTSHQRSPYA